MEIFARNVTLWTKNNLFWGSNIWNNQMWNDRYFVISNSKRTKDQLFDFFIFEFIFYFYIYLNYSNTQYIWKFIKLEIYGILSFSNCIILKMCYISKLNNVMNLMIFEIVKFGKFLAFWKLQIFRIFLIGNFLDFSNLES